MKFIVTTKQSSEQHRSELAEKMEISRHYLDDYIDELEDHQVEYLLDNWDDISADYDSGFADLFGDIVAKCPDSE